MSEVPRTAGPSGLERELADALPRLRAHVARRGPAGAADDLAQETAARALAYGGGYDARRGLWPWLRRVADRVIVDHRRREGRAPRATADLDPAAAVAAPGLDGEDAVARLVAGLPQREREVLLRFHVDGESVVEIARRMGAPEGTVKSLLSRARRRLAGWKETRDGE